MPEGICTPWADPDGGFRTEYSVYGDLDVDSLLAKARPVGPFSVWRRGYTTEFGVASSSRITLPVSDGTSKEHLFREVGEFLEREREFLLQASRAPGRVQRGLVTSITASPGEIPVGLEFPAALLALAGPLDVSWALMTFPPYDERRPTTECT
jgi:hypothetical protein